MTQPLLRPGSDNVSYNDYASVEGNHLQHSRITCRLLVKKFVEGDFDSIVVSEKEKSQRAFMQSHDSLIENTRIARELIINSPLCMVLSNKRCGYNNEGRTNWNQWITVGKTDGTASKIEHYVSAQLGKKGIKRLQDYTGKSEVMMHVFAQGCMAEIKFVANEYQDGCCTIL